MATHVSYNLSIECVENNLAPSQFEWGLTVHTYLTSHFERSAVTSRVDVGKPAASVEVKGKLPFGYKGQIPATAAICFYATAYHHNDNKVPVIVGIGSSHIFLGEIQGTFSADPKQHARILRKIGGKATATATTFSKEVELKMRTTEDKYTKAVLRVSCNTQQIGQALRFQPMHIDANTAGQALERHLQELYHSEMHMGNTIPGTDNVRCFLDISEEGQQLTGRPVPALAYIHGEIPTSNARFWENALQNVLEREEKTHRDFLTKMDANEQARIAFLLIDYPVTILPYIGDQVDRRNRKTSIAAAIHQGHLKVGYENFGEVLALMGGDCEDLAKGITKVARALKIFIGRDAASRTEVRLSIFFCLRLLANARSLRQRLGLGMSWA